MPGELQCYLSPAGPKAESSHAMQNMLGLIASSRDVDFCFKQ